jgi:hypothetical protein
MHQPSINPNKLVDVDAWVKTNYSHYLDGFKTSKSMLMEKHVGELIFWEWMTTINIT